VGRRGEGRGGGGVSRTEGEGRGRDGAGGAVDQGYAGSVVDAPVAVAPAGGGERVGNGQVGRAEADGDGDLLHGRRRRRDGRRMLCCCLVGRRGI
jgi:hypothetical protein